MGAISHALAAISGAIIALILCGICHADPAPEWAVRIMDETHERVILAPQNWYAWDLRYVSAKEAGEKGVYGNCATFAFTSAVLANKAGHPGKVVQCGKRHVVAYADGWYFDSLRDEPVRDAGCSL